MTSLDFQGLLKQERALRRARLAESETDQTSSSSSASAAQFSKSRHGGRRGKPVSSGAPGEVDGSDLVADSSKAEVKLGILPASSGAQPQEFREVAARPPPDLVKLQVGNTPTIYYVPDFVSKEDARRIMKNTYEGADAWVSLRTRRLKCWGGAPGEEFRPEALPPWVQSLCDALVRRGIFAEDERPNHVLLNEYEPGQGIMPHTDGPFYAPRTATLSLGSDAVMHFSPRVAAADIGRHEIDGRPKSSLVLRQRCLVVFADEAYSRLLHSIDAVSKETVGSRGAPVVNADLAGVEDGTVIRRELRVSLTFRRVLAGD